GDGEFGGTQAIAVPAFGVEVQLGGDFQLLKSLAVDEDVFNVDGIVFSLQEEGRRSGGAGIDAFGELREGGRVNEVCRIDRNNEVGAGVDGDFGRGRIGTVEVGVVAED